MIGSQRRSVRFRHAHTRLAGTLHLPTGTGPFPALVLLQGSGPADRTNFGYFPPITAELLAGGTAVLAYDKPGTGRSSGDWRCQTTSERAREAVSAVRALRRQSEIDPRRVGVWGISQGGWVGPLAASLTPDVACVVAVSGPGVSPLDQDRVALERAARRAGHDDAAVAAALALYDEHADAVRAGGDFAAAVARDRRGNAAWRSYMAPLDLPTWHFFSRRDPLTGRANSDYDPSPVLATLARPLLAVFGEDDLLVPVERSVERMRRALDANPLAEIRVVPGADHGLRRPDGALAADFGEAMRSWLSATWRRCGP